MAGGKPGETGGPILAALESGTKHGYRLALEITESSDGDFRFKHGTLYPVLHRLEHAALISGSWSDEEPRGKRRAYLLTGLGRRHLALATRW